MSKHKKILGYIIAAVVIFLIILLVGVLWVKFTWGEATLLAAFLTAIGIGTYWWRTEVGL